MKVKLLLISVLTVFATAISAATLNLNSLNNEQLTQLFKGNTLKVGPSAILKGKYVEDTIDVYFAPDGKMTGKWRKAMPGTATTDTGTWHVLGDKACVKWTQWGSSCATIYPMEKGYLLVDDNQEALFIPKNHFTSGNTMETSTSTEGVMSQ